VDHEGEILESFATQDRDKAAMKEIGNAEKQEVGRLANNHVENGHLPFRRRERAMNRFRRMKTLQKFAAVHASVHNLFNQERHLVSRDIFKDARRPSPSGGQSWDKTRVGLASLRHARDELPLDWQHRPVNCGPHELTRRENDGATNLV
jgi:hypothetical protein